MVHKKGNYYSEDLWSIKYLPKFKWDNLTEKFAYDARIRKEKLKNEIQKSKKEHDYYLGKKDKSKLIEYIKARK